MSDDDPVVVVFPGVDRADVERDAELFAAIAAADPGIIRTVSLLVAELAQIELEPDLLRGLAEHLHRLGDTLTMRAGRT